MTELGLSIEAREPAGYPGAGPRLDRETLAALASVRAAGP